ncbi:MAG: GDSL-type esterase/lipase family protein [Pseudomonadota bacterium]|nr:GDSL-type esterase/lipase family protein [Pseudomonadota bacterium]
MYRRQFYWLLPWLLLYAGTASTQSSQDGDSPKVKQVSSTATLVLAGASYVGGWKEPALPGYKVVNRGAGGEETHQVLARFDRDVIAAKPAAVMIWGHINNVHRAPPGGIETAKEQAKADYREMVQRARANGIEVILATEVTLSEAVGLTNRMMAFVNNLRGKQNYSAWVNEHVRDLNAWLRSYASEQGLPLWDFEKVFDDGKGFRKLEYSSDDGTHISAAGYAALTNYAQAQLRPRV